MSYDKPHHGGGGGHRRRHREDHDYHDRRREVYETPEQKLRTSIIKLGEVDPVQELPRLAKQIREQVPVVVSAISEGFRIAVTEQPYKIPYYAALLRLLHEPAEEYADGTSATVGPSLGKQILEDFWKGFQAFLDKLAWRETRLCIHFFAHLTVAGVIAVDSMCSLLQSFSAVLDEFGVSYGRGKKAALCAAEGLMISGTILNSTSESVVGEMIDAIQSYNDSIATSKWLVQPITTLFNTNTSVDSATELLDSVLATLKTLRTSEFAEVNNTIVQPYLQFPELDASLSSPFELPSILVPPEVIEMDGLSTEAGEDSQIKKDEWPEYYLRFFDNTVTPDPNTLAGYFIRSNLLDTIDIFEVNRKECARLLVEYPKWTAPGTFKPKPGAPVEENSAFTQGWQLESSIIETVLGNLMLLPESPNKSIYYMALITELCKLSPTTVGPAVGKSIRKLYGALADGLDIEVARRFAEWFAVHMSNFGFQWVWKEWIGDLALTEQHPKRCFMRRVLEFEIRLSYHDRILKTLPEPMQTDRSVISDQAPGPELEYDDPAHLHHDAAQSVLNLLRGRSKADEIISHLESLKTTLETSETHLNVDMVIRSIAVQSLLSIGSRSFSHLLNAIERYLPLLRGLASGGFAGALGVSSEAKQDILTAAATFWKRNRQMVNIVFDKLMQYQIVDPTDVVAWTFTNVASDGHLSGMRPLSLSAFEWDLLKGALDKANGRVTIARRRVTTLRKEEDDNRARAMASGGADVSSMEVDAEAKPDEIPVDSPALTTALKAFASLTREQKAALSRTLDGFVTCLVPMASDLHQNPHGNKVIESSSWEARETWTADEWNTWETWNWYRHFCRLYSPYLRNYATTIATISFAKIENLTDPAAHLMRKTWSIAIGQEP